MTVRELVLYALALWSEGSAQLGDYEEEILIKQVNITLAECFEVNNSVRLKKGLAVMKNIPVVSDMEQEVGYEGEILYDVLPYGIISKLAIDEGDNQKLSYLTGRYEIGKSCSKVIITEVSDVY